MGLGAAAKASTGKEAMPVVGTARAREQRYNTVSAFAVTYRAGTDRTSAKDFIQGVQTRGHLRAPAPEEQVQGVWGGGHLPAPVPKEPMQGVRGGRTSSRTSANGAKTSAQGAHSGLEELRRKPAPKERIQGWRS